MPNSMPFWEGSLGLLVQNPRAHKINTNFNLALPHCVSGPILLEHHGLSHHHTTARIYSTEEPPPKILDCFHLNGADSRHTACKNTNLPAMRRLHVMQPRRQSPVVSKFVNQIKRRVHPFSLREIGARRLGWEKQLPRIRK